MRIVVNDHLGHAPQVQLSRALAARGHDVLHLYSGDVQSPKADLRRKSDDASNFQIEALRLGFRAGTRFLGARVRETKFGRAVAKRAISFKPDIVIGCNNPLDVQREVQRACRNNKIPFVYWMQDFYALRMDRVVEDRGAALRLAVGSYYHWLERALLQRSSAVVVVADDYLGILAEYWDVYDRQCMVVRNWAPLDAVQPGGKFNDWSRAQGLAEKKVVLYVGALGPMEDSMQLVELARRMTTRPDAQLVVVSQGEGAEHVARAAALQAIANLRVLPFQPYEVYGEVLASADVLVGLVGSSAGVLFVPSKISSYLCAGRPIVLAAPWQNLAAQSVRESGGGRVVPPDDPAAMGETVLAYLDDDDLRRRAGQQSRLYAEKSFDIVKIADRFENLFERLRTGPPRRRQERAVSVVASG